MQNLGFYFDLGWDHIIAWGALDHLLFLIVLSAMYLISDWKKLLILITAFTLGHSLTLVLSIVDVFRLSEKLTEFLIPCTIIITALLNLLQKDIERSWLQRNYFIAFLFGLIHGMGFANFIRFFMASDDNIGWSLLGFNLGLEAGQVVVVAAILVLSYLIVNSIGLKQKWWMRILSASALLIALKMAWERFPL